MHLCALIFCALIMHSYIVAAMSSLLFCLSLSHLSSPSSSNYAAMDEMELPPGASADKAVNICGEIMKAKQDFIRAKMA